MDNPKVVLRSIPLLLATILSFILNSNPALAQNLSFSGGYQHSVLLCQNHTVWTAGINENGELGRGFTSGAGVGLNSLGQVVTGAQADPSGFLQGIKQVDAGSGRHTLALTCDGKVFAWGVNGSGQLGNGNTTTSNSPVKVLTGAQGDPSGFLSNVVFISGGDGASYAILSNGDLMAWGSNVSGEVGIGNNINQTTPQYVLKSPGVRLTGVKQVDAGDKFVIALLNDGTVWGWGENTTNQLGNGTATDAVYATQVLTGAQGHASGFLSDIVKITAGDVTGFALGTDGIVYDWGSDYAGQIGNNCVPSTSSKPTPVKMLDFGGVLPSTNVVNMACGNSTFIATLSDGSCVTVGNNGNGQLGNGTTGGNTCVMNYVRNPTNTGNITGITDVSDGDTWHFAVNGTTGDVYVWGQNNVGMLGLGDNTQRNLPVKLTLPCTVAKQCPKVFLGSNVVLCNPISTTLNAGNPGYSYKWYQNGIQIPPPDTNQTLFVNATGTYKAVVSDKNIPSGGCPACPADSDEVVISTSSAIVPNNVPFCAPPANNVNLSVTGPGNSYNWYSAATGGTRLATGTKNYTTPAISSTTTYYVEDTTLYDYTTGYPASGCCGLGGYSNVYVGATSWMNFDVIAPLTLVSVNVAYPSTTANGCGWPYPATAPFEFELVNSALTVLNTVSVTLPCASAGVPQTIPLNLTIPVGSSYRLRWKTSFDVYQYSTGAVYPFGIPNLITMQGASGFGNTSSSSFFDWQIKASSPCSRVPVIAILNCSLPVDLLSFQAQKISDDVFLNWTIDASTGNTIYFEVERSMDGINFEVITKIISSDQRKNYSYTDQNVVQSSLYYRIKIYEHDGSFSYSEIQKITATPYSEVNVYPNPSHHTLNLHISGSTYQEFKGDIFNSIGVRVGSINGNTNEIISFGQQLPSGCYLLKLSIPQQHQSAIKFCKQ